MDNGFVSIEERKNRKAIHGQISKKYIVTGIYKTIGNNYLHVVRVVLNQNSGT